MKSVIQIGSRIFTGELAPQDAPRDALVASTFCMVGPRVVCRPGLHDWLSTPTRQGSRVDHECIRCGVVWEEWSDGSRLSGGRLGDVIDPPP